MISPIAAVERPCLELVGATLALALIQNLKGYVQVSPAMGRA
jgi:hypothetical protein